MVDKKKKKERLDKVLSGPDEFKTMYHQTIWPHCMEYEWVEQVTVHILIYLINSTHKKALMGESA